MASVRNLQQLDRLARLLFLHDIVAAELRRHRVIFATVEKPLSGVRNAELHRVRFPVVLRHGVRFAAQELRNGVVA